MQWPHCTTFKVVRSLCCSHYTALCRVIRSVELAMVFTPREWSATGRHRLQDAPHETWDRRDPNSPGRLYMDVQPKNKEGKQKIWVRGRIRMHGQQGSSWHWKRESARSYCRSARTTWIQQHVCIHLDTTSNLLYPILNNSCAGVWELLQMRAEERGREDRRVCSHRLLIAGTPAATPLQDDQQELAMSRWVPQSCH